MHSQTMSMSEMNFHSSLCSILNSIVFDSRDEEKGIFIMTRRLNKICRIQNLLMHEVVEAAEAAPVHHLSSLIDREAVYSMNLSHFVEALDRVRKVLYISDTMVEETMPANKSSEYEGCLYQVRGIRYLAKSGRRTSSSLIYIFRYANALHVNCSTIVYLAERLSGGEKLSDEEILAIIRERRVDTL